MIAKKAIKKYSKRILSLFLCLVMSINGYAAIVGDNDGSAFITKAEFDSLKNDFQSQIDQYNTSIDSKIDGAIANYLAGIRLAMQTELAFDDRYKNIRFARYLFRESAHTAATEGNKGTAWGWYADGISIVYAATDYFAWYYKQGGTIAVQYANNAHNLATYTGYSNRVTQNDYCYAVELMNGKPYLQYDIAQDSA